MPDSRLKELMDTRDTFTPSPASDRLFFEAMKESFLHHYENCPVFRKICYLDGLTPDIRAIFGFIGVDDIQIAWADGQNTIRHFDSAERFEMAAEAAREIAEEVAEMV